MVDIHSGLYEVREGLVAFGIVTICLLIFPVAGLLIRGLLQLTEAPHDSPREDRSGRTNHRSD